MSEQFFKKTLASSGTTEQVFQVVRRGTRLAEEEGDSVFLVDLLSIARELGVCERTARRGVYRLRDEGRVEFVYFGRRPHFIERVPPGGNK